MKPSLVAAAIVLLACPIVSRAQAFGNTALFEPVVDIVNSGAKLDAVGVVSADRKYVTLTMRPQNAQLLALQTFQFQGGGFGQLPGGFVGGVVPVPAGAAGAVIPHAVNAPVRVGSGVGGAVFFKRGITPLILGD